MRPLIGITAHLRLVEEAGTSVLHHVANASYVKAVRKAGGIPVLLPMVDPEDAAVLLDRVDGLVVTGGDDVDPSSYGEERHPKTGATDPARDRLDLAVCREAVQRDHPTLAICRGAQVLGVALGGALVQHLDDHFDMARYNQAIHRVKVGPGSTLANWIGVEEVEVNSLHHQASGALGPGAVATAYAEDGTVEGIEAVGRRNVVGVQWHPELLRHRPEHLALFQSLVSSASAYR
ncbi:MAG TPA: gamma-glutamyl-gamma-aminobutyrate hydrolase family protein [Acidimicrobiales bacterium]|nr:gamma-glutamyl-gamma-aminobutyrate hydrolase family protein [Acidimicrobiales bacterium]